MNADKSDRYKPKFSFPRTGESDDKDDKKCEKRNSIARITNPKSVCAINADGANGIIRRRGGDEVEAKDAKYDSTQEYEVINDQPIQFAPRVNPHFIRKKPNRVNGHSCDDKAIKRVFPDLLKLHSYIDIPERLVSKLRNFLVLDKEKAMKSQGKRI